VAFEKILSAGNNANKDSAFRFGMSCRSWSECSSGLCASECRCGADPKRSCSCSCGGLQSAPVQGSAPASMPSCCAFFVGDEACGDACPPCSQKQCHQFKKGRSCRWGCTKGTAAGQCSVSPDAFVFDREQCSECCNANFCKDEGLEGLRGDWIENSSAGGWQPGLDADGQDLWTGIMVPCPVGERWAAEGCQRICELPPFTRVDRVVGLGNNTWIYDEHTSHQPQQRQQQQQQNQIELLVDGAVIHAVCVHGATGSKKYWQLTCLKDGSWNGQKPDCELVRCPVPMDPLGSWEGIPEYGHNLTLNCTEGYEPRDGDAVFRCGLDRHGPEQLARCSPAAKGEIAAQAFRGSLRDTALCHFTISVVVFVIVMLLCWRDRPNGGSRAGDGFTHPLLSFWSRQPAAAAPAQGGQFVRPPMAGGLDAE